MSTASATRNVCFVGLGVMGFPMAGHLARNGFQVTVYNRSVAKSERWTSTHTGKFVRKLRDVAQSSVVISCVGNDEDLRAVYLGEHGLLANMPRGALVIDHTTASAEMASRLAEAAADRDIAVIDAPVSGGQRGAEEGHLTAMCGGTPDAFDRAQPYLQCYTRVSRLMGSAGAGQKTKMVNQIAIGGLVQALAEALIFAEQSGLDSRTVIEVISQGAAQSWQMDHRWESMLEGSYEHGFAVDWMRKDLNIVLTEARQLGISLPVTALVDQFYGDIQNMGGGRWDTSSLLARLKHFAASASEKAVSESEAESDSKSKSESGPTSPESGSHSPG